ncbi:hypothetical protein LTR91_002178 [Friedmanniomyces endolithicus]|uniref:RING-type domain-containing protein n=1 Tax=Friedmanniomyces endolithicus TaxID=329885 RepID=A0AAN6L028_9PEZI|nr:hypothetical protein LTS00_003158 [Friedmanniomyces endolithicus]KAK0975684.1 hypothetical protein LTS01_013778 [Friedmanniomyces endolithicus]KAK1011706.1 hypothetical protein LTR91_002178 [Friedmanniomyces endolithicus]KAK1015805.1 hypothetical protein LTR54_003534 [Friedmanniomyces endolithicus]
MVPRPAWGNNEYRADLRNALPSRPAAQALYKSSTSISHTREQHISADDKPRLPSQPINGKMATLPTRSEYLTSGITSVSGTELAKNDQTMCTICQSELTSPIRLHDETSGGRDHVYCKPCVLAWFGEKKFTCPMCRLVLFRADPPTMPRSDAESDVAAGVPLRVFENIDSDDEDEDEDEDDEMVLADPDDDMEVLVQLRLAGARLQQQHVAVEESLGTVLTRRAAAFQEGTLEVAHGAYRQRYVSTMRRASYTGQLCDLGVIALTASLRDAYFSRLLHTLGVDNVTNVDAVPGRGLVTTAACHPLATVVYTVLRTAIQEARVVVGTRISVPRLEHRLRSAIASNEWLSHLADASERSGADETPPGMEEYVRDLIAEVLAKLWTMGDAVPGAPRRSRAAQRAATGQGLMASMGAKV